MDFLDLAKNFGVPSACCIGLMYYLFNVKLKEDREDRLNERTKDREDMKELYKQMGIMNVTNTKLVETNKSLVECNKKIVDTNQILADKVELKLDSMDNKLEAIVNGVTGRREV